MGLLLKVTTAHGHSAEVIRRQADQVLAPLGQCLERRPDIVLWDRTLYGAEMAALYRSVDAFVLPSRGEGWGRPYMEAMASGLATIGTRGSGNDDFMNEGNCFLIPATLANVPQAAAEEVPVYHGHRWLEPDAAEFCLTLRRVFSDAAERKAVGRKAAADIREAFSREHARHAVETNLAAAELRFAVTPPAEVQAGQIRVEIEGEFFAAHSFRTSMNSWQYSSWQAPTRLVVQASRLQNAAETAAPQNENAAETAAPQNETSFAVSLRRVYHNPTYDGQSPIAYRLRPYVGRSLPGGPQVTIRHAFPPNWNPPEQGRWVHIQPWEFGALPLDWVAPLRDRVDEIWAPSTYVKRVYERSGIAGEKVYVIPWGVDPAVFHPQAPPLLLPTRKRFKFLFIGGTTARKGFDVLFDAYLSEFMPADNVCLVVKDMGTNSFYRHGNCRERSSGGHRQPFGGGDRLRRSQHDARATGRGVRGVRLPCRALPGRGFWTADPGGHGLRPFAHRSPRRAIRRFRL